MADGTHRHLWLEGGRRISYREWGTDGDPLVAIHGLLDSSAGFAGIADGLSDLGIHVIAVDLPGFGDSSLPRHATIASYADDIEAALGEIGVANFTLCGHSLCGGRDGAGGA